MNMEEQSLGGAPVQHLGAASREQIPSESDLDGDFASSAEAEAAEAAMEANYDAELTEEHLQELWRADTAARDREIGGTMGNYVTDGLNREYEEPGEEPGGAIFSQARGQEPRAEEAVSHGSGPRTQAVTHSQTPGHLCSMPQSGPKNPHASAGRAAEQPASGGGVSDTLDQDLAHYRQLAETLRRERDQERLSAERRAKQDELAALRRECEQLQTAASQATPRAPPGIVPSISPDLSRSCGWGNAATGTGSAGTVLGACGHQGGFDSRGAAAAGPALPPPGDAMGPTATPPGLEFLGREPPSGALARRPREREVSDTVGNLGLDLNSILPLQVYFAPQPPGWISTDSQHELPWQPRGHRESTPFVAHKQLPWQRRHGDRPHFDGRCQVAQPDGRQP